MGLGLLFYIRLGFRYGLYDRCWGLRLELGFGVIEAS